MNAEAAVRALDPGAVLRRMVGGSSCRDAGSAQCVKRGRNPAICDLMIRIDECDDPSTRLSSGTISELANTKSRQGEQPRSCLPCDLRGIVGRTIVGDDDLDLAGWVVVR